MARKNARSNPDLASIVRSQPGRLAPAVSANPALTTSNADAANPHFPAGVNLRNDLKVHSLRAHVVRDVFGGDSQMIGAGNHLVGYQQVARTGVWLGGPPQADRRRTVQAGHESPGVLRGPHFERHGFAFS